MSFHSSSNLFPQFHGLNAISLIGPKRSKGSNPWLPMRLHFVPNYSKFRRCLKAEKYVPRDGVLTQGCIEANSSSSRSSNNYTTEDGIKTISNSSNGRKSRWGIKTISNGSNGWKSKSSSNGRNGSNKRGVLVVDRDDTKTKTTLLPISKNSRTLQTQSSTNDDAKGIVKQTKHSLNQTQLNTGKQAKFKCDQTLPIVQSAKVATIKELITKNTDPNSLASTLLNIADNLISAFLTPPTIHPCLDPAIQLAGWCTPVMETPPTSCSVIRGEIPGDINGAYIRNSPNATYIHEGDGIHLFDGDGMLQSVLIENGAAIFCARYVKTNRFRQESAAGRPLFPKYIGGMSGPSGIARWLVTTLRVLLGLLDISTGSGVSNTSVAFFAGKVLSMSEDDMPYVIRVSDCGELETAGKFEFPWKFNMCSHPKVDYLTGELYAFSLQPTPYLTPYSFFRVSADEVKSPDIPVPVTDLPVVHDFAITRNFVVFPENQLVIRPAGLLDGQMPVTCDSNKVSRFCILPRYGLPEDAIDNAQWFDAPGLNCLHFLAAWEEDNDVVLITPVHYPPENTLEFPMLNTYSTLSEIRLNRETGEVCCRELCSRNLCLGTVNPKFIGGCKTRYGYLASGPFPNFNGIVKVDFDQGAVVGERQFDEGCYCGEPSFVPKESDDNNVAEDDGYVVCYVTHEKSGVSEFLIMDAVSPSLEIVAAIELPSRVPVGFHGCFITKDQLASQH